MGEYQIEVKKVQSRVKEIESISGEIGKGWQQLEGVNLQLTFLKEYRGLGKTISWMIDELNANQKHLRQYSDVLQQVTKEYQDTENRILGTNSKNIDWEFDKLINGISGKFGLLGGLASMVNKAAAGWSDGFGVDDALNLMKGAVSATGKTAGFIASEDKNWLEFLVGIPWKKVKETAVKSANDNIFCRWGKAIGKEVKDYNFSSAAKVGDKIKVAAKWIGDILGVALTAHDNYKEHGGMTERAWGETIVESALDIVGDMVIGATITALLGTPPGLVVGGGTVFAKWCADFIYKAVTGSENGIMEDVSDAVCDWFSPYWNKGKELFSSSSQKVAFA